MGKKHDEVVYSLNEKKIEEVFSKYLFGEVGIWGPNNIHNILNQTDLKKLSIKDLKQENIPEFHKMTSLKDEKKELSIGDFQDILKHNYKEIELHVKLKKTFKINIEYETPIIKGDGQYRTTKGYLDLLIDLEPIRNEFFSSINDNYKLDLIDNKFKRLIIDVKLEKDFEDTGQIIRQMNEYREYYRPFSTWGIYDRRDSKMIWCVYCDGKIPNISINMLISSGYICVSEGKLITKKILDL